MFMKGMLANRAGRESTLTCLCFRLSTAPMAERQTEQSGTYAGIDQRRLEPGAAMRLSSGDILWLGPHVRIEVRHD